MRKREEEEEEGRERKGKREEYINKLVFEAIPEVGQDGGLV